MQTLLPYFATIRGIPTKWVYKLPTEAVDDGCPVDLFSRMFDFLKRVLKFMSFTPLDMIAGLVL